MIPKIAHFHWEGRPINWLRMMGIWTFARLNPRWEVRLLRSPDHVREKGLPRLANEADWTWLEALYREGGFAFATDTVFIRPIPDEWCESDMCLCTNGGTGFYHASFGSIAGTLFLEECIKACESMKAKALGFQDMGLTLLNAKLGGVKSWLDCGMSFFDMPKAAMTPVAWSEPELCWGSNPLPITDETVAVTWFGGHESSKFREWDVPEKHGESAIVKLALSAVDET